MKRGSEEVMFFLVIFGAFLFWRFLPEASTARIEVSKLASSGVGVARSVRLLSCADYAQNYIQDGSVASRLQ